MDQNNLLEPDSPAMGLPKIDASEGNLAVISEQAWHAIQKSNEPPYVFVFGDVITRVVPSGDDVALKVLDLDKMRHLLARTARWERLKMDGGRWKPVDVHPPLAVARDLLADPYPRVPVLSRIVRAPVFARDGSLRTEAGYHEAAQSYFSPSAGFSIPTIATPPTAHDVRNAVRLIRDELLHDFPYATDSDRSHAIAMLLEPFARNLILGPTPLYLVEKPKPGTGAGLLVEVLTHPSLGASVPVMTEGRDDEEWRKRLTAKLLGAPSIVLIDNVRRRLDSAALSAVLTANTWEDRILKQSRMARIPVRCTWIATGNNPTLSNEMSRRAVRVRMDPKTDRPWLRTGFRHELPGWAHVHRSDLVGACLTIVSGWIAAGRPMPSKSPTLGSFGDWCNVMGGILEFAGISGFLGNLEASYEASDVEGNVWRRFVVVWWEKFGGHDVGVAELYPIVTDADLFDLGVGNEKSQRTRLGLLLRKNRDSHFGDYRVEAGEVIKGAQQWHLVNVGQRSPNVPPNVHQAETEPPQGFTSPDTPAGERCEPFSDMSAHARASETSGYRENVHNVLNVHQPATPDASPQTPTAPEDIEEFEL